VGDALYAVMPAHNEGRVIGKVVRAVLESINPDLVPLRALTLEILVGSGRRALLVPVPSSLLLGPLWLLEKVAIKRPSTSTT